MRQAQYQRRGSRVGRLRRRDLAIFQQGIDDQISPPLRAVRMIDGRIQRRPFRQTGEQRRFFQSQILGRLAEIKLRRSLEPIHPVPQRNLVRIQRKDLRLGEAALDLNGQHRFLHLAMK